MEVYGYYAINIKCINKYKYYLNCNINSMNKSDNKGVKKVKKVLKKKKMVKKKVKKEKTVENTIKKDEKVDNMQILVFDEDDTYMEEQKKLSIISKNGDIFRKNTTGSEETVKEREEEVTKDYVSFIESLKLPFWSDLPEEKRDPFVKVYNNILDPHFCDSIINKFEKRDELNLTSAKGITFLETQLMKDNKNKNELKGIASSKITTEVHITQNKDILKKEDEYLSSVLTEIFGRYSRDIVLHTGLRLFQDITDTGYQMQKYNKNEGRYTLHHDFTIDIINRERYFRILTFLFYLNDVEEGGETTFPTFKVKPKKGTLLLFPATWNYVHSGNVPRSSDKYIITGWMYEKG